MFSLHDFIMKTLLGMIGSYPEFQIREFALNWYERGKLTEGDLQELEASISPSGTEEEESEVDLE